MSFEPSEQIALKKKIKLIHILGEFAACGINKELISSCVRKVSLARRDGNMVVVRGLSRMEYLVVSGAWSLYEKDMHDFSHRIYFNLLWC